MGSTTKCCTNALLSTDVDGDGNRVDLAALSEESRDVIVLYNHHE